MSKVRKKTNIVEEAAVAYIPRTLTYHNMLGQAIDDIAALIQLTREGLAYKTFDRVMKATGYTFQQWSKYLHLTERTLQRHKKDQKIFKPIQAERIIEIARLHEVGQEIFGSKEKFDLWMRSFLIPLGGSRPIDLLDSSFGIDMLKEELGRIEHGILA